jgi:hypothetical protein
MCLLYIDDICIYSEIEDHLDSVTAVFKRVLASGAKLKISTFYQTGFPGQS